MKPSAQLAWTKKQRVVLAGSRAPHPLDPPRTDRTAEAWARVAGWVADAAGIPDESPDPALRALLASVRAERETPVGHDARREALRVLVATAGLEAREKLPCNEPRFAESFACAWAAQGFAAALTHPAEAPRFVGNHARLCLEQELPPGPLWINGPWRLGGRQLDVGYEYVSALRRHVFELDPEGYDAALRAGTDLRARVLESDRDDRMTMLYVLAFVYSRDGRWAREHVRDCLETPRYASFAGADLLLPSVTDPALALALLRQRPAWLEPYGFNEPLLLDVVESLGSEAAPVLRAIDTSTLKARVQKRVDDAVKLAES